MNSQSGHQSVKALALFFASLAAAGPLGNRPMHVARQDAGSITASASPAITTSGATSIAGSATLDATLQPVVAAAAVEATVSGTARMCSIDSVTAYTTTAFMTLDSTTSPMYTIDLDPTLGCTCDDGWMAGLGTSTGTDGLATVTVSVSPLVARGMVGSY